MTPETPAPTLQPDLCCSQCGYNLRGLPDEGACPECGRTLQETITYYRQLHGPAWLRRQSVAMLWLTALPIMLVVLPQLSIVGFTIRQLYPLMFLAAGICAAIGAYRLAESPESEREAAYARGLKLVALAYAAIWAPLVFILSLEESAKLARTSSIVQLTLQAGLYVLVFRRLIILGRRIADPSLIFHATATLWVLLGDFAVSMLMSQVQKLAEVAREWTLLAALVSASSALGLLSMVFLLGRLHEALKRAADETQARAV